MTTAAYLRLQAKELRDMAREAAHELRVELEKLAAQCEKLANDLAGNGHAHPEGEPADEP